MPQFLDTLRWQFRVAWSLGENVYWPRLTDELCLWMPHASALTVSRDASGDWVADWPEDESDVAPVVSIAWLTWHLQWWMTSALAEALGQHVPARESVHWPGADGVGAELDRLANAWQHDVLANAGDWDLQRPTRYPWTDPQPLHRLLAWVNVELMKNVAEIGDVVRLHAATHDW